MESLDVFVGGAECIGPPRHIRGMGGILGRLVAGRGTTIVELLVTGSNRDHRDIRRHRPVYPESTVEVVATAQALGAW